MKLSWAKQQGIKFGMVCIQEHWQKIISVSIWNSMPLTFIFQSMSSFGITEFYTEFSNLKKALLWNKVHMMVCSNKTLNRIRILSDSLFFFSSGFAFNSYNENYNSFSIKTQYDIT